MPPGPRSTARTPRTTTPAISWSATWRRRASTRWSPPSGSRPADLIKIDVQGAELDVIAGAKTALSRCEALIIELSLASYNKDAPLIGETLPAITQLGFRCVDICELHRAPAGNVLQADFLFVKPALFAAIGKASGLGD